MTNWFTSWFQGGTAGGQELVRSLKVTDETVLRILTLARGAFQPVLEESGRPDSAAPEADRVIRQKLAEVLADLDRSLDDLTVEQATRVLTKEVPRWFQERREAEDARVAELGRVIAGMGAALKSIQGGENEFYGSFARTMEEMKQTTGVRDVRQAGLRMIRLLDEATEKLSTQQRTNEKRIANLAEMVHGLNKELDRAKVLLQEDPLTKVYNRGSFDSQAAALLRKSRLAPFKWSLIMVDLDHFKSVNDRFGHVGGDRLLQAAARAMQGVVLRSADFVARYGGEEFAVVLSDCSLDGALVVGERLRLAVEGLVVPNGSQPIRATASFGVAEACELDTVEGIVKRADAALYIAKGTGRNRVVGAGVGAGAEVDIPDVLRRTLPADAARSSPSTSPRRGPILQGGGLGRA
jgi:diguanylate cyclase (GGDEF)-like protein